LGDPQATFDSEREKNPRTTQEGTDSNGTKCMGSLSDHENLTVYKIDYSELLGG
jgi:hypothetical protein